MAPKDHFYKLLGDTTHDQLFVFLRESFRRLGVPPFVFMFIRINRVDSRLLSLVVLPPGEQSLDLGVYFLDDKVSMGQCNSLNVTSLSTAPPFPYQ